MAKDKDYKRLIHNMRWLRLRKEKLTNYPICERCLEEGIITPATEVHHITPVEDAISYKEKMSLMYDYHNLKSMCHQCHVLTHIEIGRSGKEQNKRKSKSQLKQFINKYLQDD